MFQNPSIRIRQSCFSPPLRNLLVLSLSFLFMYISYSALFNLQSSLNREANLGVASLSVLFGSIVVFSPISHLLIRAIGAKNVTIVSWLTFIIYTASNFYPTWATLVPASALIGTFFGQLWLCQNLYFTEFGGKYATLRGLSSEKDQHSILSKFGGFFFMCYFLGRLLGNMVSSLVLKTGTNANASQTLDLDLCGANDCPWTDYSNGSSNTTEGFIEPERHVVYIFLGTLLGFNACGLLLTVFALPSLEQTVTSKSSTTCGHSAKCLRMVIDPVMIPLLPLFMTETTLNSIMAGGYTKAFISCPLGVQWVGFVMTIYGLFCATTSLSVNHIAKYIGRIAMFTSAILLAIVSHVVMLVWQPSKNDGLSVFFIIPLMAGVSMGITSAQFSVIVAQLFQKDKSAAFAVLVTSKAAGYTLTFTLSMFMCLRERLVVALCVYILGLVGYAWTELQVRRKSSAYEKYKVKDQTDVTMR